MNLTPCFGRRKGYETRKYPTDLTDAQWKLVRPLIPKPKPGGRPQSVDRREILNAVFYLVRGGIQWRMLPHDFPPWGTVHYYYRQWRRDGTWEAIQNALRTKVRHKAGRHKSPSAAIIDSQTVKTTEMGVRKRDRSDIAKSGNFSACPYCQ